MIRDKKYQLLAKPSSESGIYQSILKEETGWQFLNFQARLMKRGEKWKGNTWENEYAIILLGGNYFGVQPFNGRYGSFGGALFKNENSILLGKSIGLNLMNQSVRHFNIIDFNSHKFLLATINDGDAQVYKLLQR